MKHRRTIRKLTRGERRRWLAQVRAEAFPNLRLADVPRWEARECQAIGYGLTVREAVDDLGLWLRERAAG